MRNGELVDTLVVFSSGLLNLDELIQAMTRIHRDSHTLIRR
ncbi:hypothetical protein THF1D04_280029 [Vibrio owensii]|uniref:Uncharacterized protein n=1 Tax=Vibrio owensii TaxID=696485 RepID=A0AAU9Q6T2_9VIBR|nr:hypothetical protein THF1D04_280029 [Vibrio owensii]